jgi:hypothetical protein
MLAALSTTMILTACAGSVASPPVSRSLPPAPAFMAPVAIPTIAIGDDVRAALAKHRASLLGANKRLDDSRTWYAKVRRSFAGK